MSKCFPRRSIGKKLSVGAVIPFWIVVMYAYELWLLITLFGAVMVFLPLIGSPLSVTPKNTSSTGENLIGRSSGYSATDVLR